MSEEALQKVANAAEAAWVMLNWLGRFAADSGRGDIVAEVERVKIVLSGLCERLESELEGRLDS